MLSKMTELKLSIILPVYNVENYLERCIRSLEDQDIPKAEYELIVVNDGSPDNSREVVLRLMNEFANIVLIDQENRGVSVARNTGINKARGRYLLFVDPDDYVLPNSIGVITRLANDSEAEVVFLGYSFLNVNNICIAEILHQEYQGKVYSGIEAYFLYRGDGKTDPDRSVAILFQRSFMSQNALQYLAGTPYLEDGEFMARVLCLCQRCVFLGEEFYIRTTRSGSATNSHLFYQKRAIDGFIRAAKNLSEFRRLLGLSFKQQIFLNQPVVKFTLLGIQSCFSNRSFKLFNDVIKQLKEAGLSKLQLEGCVPLYVKYGRMYNISPRLFFCYYVARLIKSKIINFSQ